LSGPDAAGHYAAVYAHFLFRTGYGKALGGDARYRLFRCKQRAWLFVNLLAAWLNNEPAQTVDVMVYGMQSGSETFSVHPCNESGNARNTVCDATH
jgi:hypothetical protein